MQHKQSSYILKEDNVIWHVLDDLEKLEMKDTSFEEIGNMKKGYFMKVVKLRNEEKVFNCLEKVKKSHSKVRT